MTTLLLCAWLAGLQPQARPAIDVVLMVDVSHSVTYGAIKRDRTLVHDAGAALAASLAPGDTARVGTFGDTITLETARLTDAAAVRSAADALTDKVGGGSPLWDALVAAVAALEDGKARRGVVVITDGRSTANRTGFADALDRLERARIPVYVVMFDKSDHAIPDPGARLVRIAKATGGTCLFVERPAIAGAIARAAAALRDGLSATAR